MIGLSLDISTYFAWFSFLYFHIWIIQWKLVENAHKFYEIFQLHNENFKVKTIWLVHPTVDVSFWSGIYFQSHYNTKSKVNCFCWSSLQLLSASSYCISTITHFSFLFSELVLSILISEPHYFLHSFHYNSFVLYLLMKFCFVDKEEMYTHSVSQSSVWMKHSHAHTYVSTHVNISMSRLLVYS